MDYVGRGGSSGIITGIAIGALRGEDSSWLDYAALYGSIGALAGLEACVLSATRVNLRFKDDVVVKVDDLHDEPASGMSMIGNIILIGAMAVPAYLGLTWLGIKYWPNVYNFLNLWGR